MQDIVSSIYSTVKEQGSPLEHGTAGWEIHPFIVPLEGDLIVEKGTPDSFHETNLHTKLQNSAYPG